jgi:hypothetical protein
MKDCGVPKNPAKVEAEVRAGESTAQAAEAEPASLEAGKDLTTQEKRGIKSSLGQLYANPSRGEWPVEIEPSAESWGSSRLGCCACTLGGDEELKIANVRLHENGRSI